MVDEIPPKQGDGPQPDPGDEADLSALPWTHIVVAEKDDAERSREMAPTLKVIGLNDSRLTTELPTGSGSCVLCDPARIVRAA